ncbi:alpha/beta hydrolase [Spiroplasma endosymbiont of Othius punctulatus]|uniref:alpha/beta hydrolase n=1 Tax=Spiroplasma endosymbiont of Othius punctulatus TaxID=3066289 RepID=UPI0030CC32F9
MKNLLVSLAIGIFNSNSVCRKFTSIDDMFNKFLVEKERIETSTSYKVYEQSDLIQFETTTSDDLKIAGKYYINKTNKDSKWVIVMHGYTQTKEITMATCSFYAGLGFNVVGFDFRNHGQSDDEYVSFGVSEQQDLISVIKYITNELGAKAIGLVGFSMGAYTLNLFALTAGDFIKKYNIKFGISDSTFFDIKPTLKRIALQEASQIQITDDLIDSIFHEYKSNYKINTDLLNIDNVVSNQKNTFPILFIHGEKDKITDPEDSLKLYNIRSNLTKSKNDNLIYIKGAGHIKSFVHDSKNYVANVSNFISDINFEL